MFHNSCRTCWSDTRNIWFLISEISSLHRIGKNSALACSYLLQSLLNPRYPALLLPEVVYHIWFYFSIADHSSPNSRSVLFPYLHASGYRHDELFFSGMFCTPSACCNNPGPSLQSLTCLSTSLFCISGFWEVVAHGKFNPLLKYPQSRSAPSSVKLDLSLSLLWRVQMDPTYKTISFLFSDPDAILFSFA